MPQLSPKTKPERIARVLEAEIRSGVLLNGAALSSESALVDRFSVSRSTIRKGLEILSDKGLIQTRVGIGSFVTYAGAVIDNDLGWSLALSDGGPKMQTSILKLARQPMDLKCVDFDATEVLAVDRIRSRGTGEPALTLERARVPWRGDFASILTDGLEDGSLSTTLGRRGFLPASGKEWANVLPALSKKDADLLGRTTGEPMLYLRRLTRTSEGEILEYVESLLDPALFGLQMEF